MAISKSMLHISMLLSLAIALPGCDWFGSKTQAPAAAVSTKTETITDINDGTPVLVRMEGKAIVTQGSLDRQIELAMQANPQLRELFKLYPQLNLEEEIINALIGKEVIKKYIQDEQIHLSPEYTARLNEIVSALQDQLNMECFATKFPATASEDQVRKMYEECKAQFIVSHGGTKTVGVSFDTKEAAEAFAQKVKTAGATQLEAIAKDEKLSDKVRDFKFVHANSVAVDPQVKAKIVAAGKIPAVETVQGADKKYWVIALLEKQEPQHRSFEEMKEELKTYVTQQNQQQVMKDQVEILSKQYGIERNEEYFKNKQDQQKSALSEKMLESTPEMPKAPAKK